MIIRRPAATARSTCSKPCVSTRPPARRRGSSANADTRPQPARDCPTSALSGARSRHPKAREKRGARLSRARLEMPSRGPMVRASAPPAADAQSIGSKPNTPNNRAAPQPAGRCASSRPSQTQALVPFPSPTSRGEDRAGTGRRVNFLRACCTGPARWPSSLMSRTCDRALAANRPDQLIERSRNRANGSRCPAPRCRSGLPGKV